MKLKEIARQTLPLVGVFALSCAAVQYGKEHGASRDMYQGLECVTGMSEAGYTGRQVLDYQKRMQNEVMFKYSSDPFSVKHISNGLIAAGGGLIYRLITPEKSRDFQDPVCQKYL